ncbi:glycosyltransferase [uncultured Algibacter sp.]|uniref:glycosyltransferase n=1 Tax=uncultured Algibacter sp. TaxID=298659 RepID=UPI002607CC9F|nr:glycosyltransferase [uncultured Algibacter sp.]
MNRQIAVLLPHYNNQVGLQLTLNSLLSESEEFTVFVFDDGSDEVDKTDEIIKNFRDQLDIRFIKNAENIGIAKTLNKGLKFIIELNQYEFIARIDAGDVNLNDRFKHQKQAFLNDNDLGLVASWVRFVDMERKKLFEFKPPSSHNDLKEVIHLYNPFVHPSVMYRCELVSKLGYYPENYPALEDHAFFFKIKKTYTTKVLENILLEYEVNPESISTKNRHKQTKSRIKLFLNEYKFGFYTTLGLFRAILTHILPQKLLILMKRFLYK